MLGRVHGYLQKLGGGGGGTLDGALSLYVIRGVAFGGNAPITCSGPESADGIKQEGPDDVNNCWILLESFEFLLQEPTSPG